MTDQPKDLKKSARPSADSASMAASRVFSREAIAQFNRLVREAQTLSFVTRDSALQEQAISHLTSSAEAVAAQKAAFAASRDEDGANACLAVQCLIASMVCELQMWLCLKRDEPEKAWDLLIEAQQHAGAALRAHDCGGIIEPRLLLYDILERYVFPPQVFLSTGFLVLEEHCSICRTAYADCPHIKGRAYMGEFCAQVLTKLEPREVSFVPEPRDKRCRATHFSEAAGRRNRMTWKLERNPHNEPRTNE